MNLTFSMSFANVLLPNQTITANWLFVDIVGLIFKTQDPPDYNIMNVIQEFETFR